MFDFDVYLKSQWAKDIVSEYLALLSAKQKREVLAILSGQFKPWLGSPEATRDGEFIFRSAIFFQSKVIVFQPDEHFEIKLKDLQFESIKQFDTQIHLGLRMREGPFLDFALAGFDELRYFVDCFVRPQIEISTMNVVPEEFTNLGLVHGNFPSPTGGNSVELKLRSSADWKTWYRHYDSAFVRSESQVLLEAWNLGATHVFGLEATVAREFEYRDFEHPAKSRARNPNSPKLLFEPPPIRRSVGQETVFLTGTAFKQH